MNLPWMRFHTRDWLDNKELRRCSPTARAILTDLMCLAHEGEPYGHLADKTGALTTKYMASRCVVTTGQFLRAVSELKQYGRVSQRDDGVLFIARMVEDERIRLARAVGGGKGGNPALVNHELNGKVNHEGYPCLKNDSRAGARADSDSSSLSGKEEILLDEIADRIYRLHPKKWGMSLVGPSLVAAVGRGYSLTDIEACHKAWCETAGWSDNNGNFAPKLPVWLDDDGFTKWPAGKEPPRERNTRKVRVAKITHPDQPIEYEEIEVPA